MASNSILCGIVRPMKNNSKTETSLLAEIEKYSEVYEFHFQFWGKGSNNVFVSKNDVELYNSGDHETPEDAIKEALRYIYKVKPNLL